MHSVLELDLKLLEQGAVANFLEDFFLHTAATICLYNTAKGLGKGMCEKEIPAHKPGSLVLFPFPHSTSEQGCGQCAAITFNLSVSLSVSGSKDCYLGHKGKINI